MCSAVTKSRYKVLDVAKGIGIILVVASHTLGAGFMATRMYFMPLFFFLAGITYKHESFGVFLKKKVKRLYLPFVGWEIVYLLLNPLFVHIGFVSTGYGGISTVAYALSHIVLFDNISILLAPVWFVTALFFAYILVWIVNSVISRLFCGKGITLDVGSVNSADSEKTQLMTVISCIVAVCFIYSGIYIGDKQYFVVEWSYNFKACIGVFFEASGYCMLGGMAKSLGENLNHQRSIQIIVFALLIIFERMVRPVSDMRINTYSFPLLAPMFAVVGIAGIMTISRIFESSRVFAFLGKCSMTIMFLHPLAIKLIGFVQVRFLGYDIDRLSDWQLVSDDMGWKLVYMTAGVVLPAVCALGAERMRSIIKRLSKVVNWQFLH